MNDFSKLSVVVPIGPNDSSWRSLLENLAFFGPSLEIILSACQKQPEEITLPNNVRWLCGPQGRARQLNRGGRQAQRPFVWFLHADSHFNKEIVTVMQRFIDSNESSLGYFKLRFAADGPRVTQLNAWAANLRSRLFGLPFGDQGFILKKSQFLQLQGFDENVEVGEDLDFAVRFKAAGLSLREIPAELTTSARRYRHYGWLKTTLRHLWLTWQLTQQSKQRLNESK